MGFVCEYVSEENIKKYSLYGIASRYMKLKRDRFPNLDNDYA